MKSFISALLAVSILTSAGTAGAEVAASAQRKSVSGDRVRARTSGPESLDTRNMTPELPCCGGSPSEGTPPTIEIILPQPNAVIRGDFLYSAAAMDDQEMMSIDVYIGNKRIEHTMRLDLVPEELLRNKKVLHTQGEHWDSTRIKNGVNKLSVIAFDRSGNMAQSAVKIVIDN